MVPQPHRDPVSPSSVPRGAGKGGRPSSSPGQPGLAAHRPCSRLASALTGSRGASPLSEWPPLPGDTSTKQCWPFCKPGVAPGPEGHCKEPSPLIRTGRLGLHPAQAQVDFSGHKTCKLFPVGSLEMQPAGAWEASHFPWPSAGQVQLRPLASWTTEASGWGAVCWLTPPRAWHTGALEGDG